MPLSINKVNWLPMAAKITLILESGKWPLWLANVTCGQSGNIKPQTNVFWDHIPADEDTTFLQTVGNHTPYNTA